MNFLRDKPLKILSIYLLTILAAIFIIEYLAFRYTLSELTEAERKIDFARSVQVHNQQIAIQVEVFIQGKAIGAELVSRLDHQDYLLGILSEGGRVEDSDLMLHPLSRLPMITFVNLKQSWLVYKQAITSLVNTSQASVSTVPISPDSLNDSAGLKITNSVPEANIDLKQAKLAAESRWISLSRWYNNIIEDLESEVITKQRAVMNWGLLFVLLNIGTLFLLYFLFRKYVLSPLKLLELNTARKEFSAPGDKNEIADVAKHVNATIEDLRDATEFVISIGEGKLDLDYRTLDANYDRGKNKLADSLIEMQSKLKALNEEERKRQWVNEGLTKFVDILRASNDDLNRLGDRIISALVQYTNSNQGAIYILNDDDAHNKHLELLSLFAFDIKKHSQQKIRLGEGILGQTFLEKETTYLTDIPESYIRITSGLGDAPPTSVLMVPLKVDTQAYGMLELASFHVYSPHEISFVEKLGESIAATLASVKGVQKNRQLIEQFRQQTEEMRAQEEEMRQNMEELQATQEEIARKERSYIDRIRELEARPASAGSLNELQDLRSNAESQAQEYQSKLEELRRQLAEEHAPGDDWALAKEVEKMLRVNLDALKLTQAEPGKKV